MSAAFYNYFVQGKEEDLNVNDKVANYNAIIQVRLKL